MADDVAEIGVLGGSGLVALLEDARPVEVATPYGAPSAPVVVGDVGGLRPELGPGSLVVPDQLVDRTSGRTQTSYDTGAVHVPFADPCACALDGLAPEPALP